MTLELKRAAVTVWSAHRSLSGLLALFHALAAADDVQMDYAEPLESQAASESVSPPCNTMPSRFHSPAPGTGAD